MKITKELLKELDACRPQIELFCTLFPKGCLPTVENVTIAYANDLHVDWLCRKLLLGLVRSTDSFQLIEDTGCNLAEISSDHPIYDVRDSYMNAQISAFLMDL